MFKIGQLVTTNLMTSGGWHTNKSVTWSPIYMNVPYILVDIKYTTWSSNKVAVILSERGILLEVILDVLIPI